MHAPHQVELAHYQAGRAYQRLYECNLQSLARAAAAAGDGGHIPNPISPARMAAAKRQRSVEGARQFGFDVTLR
jgi:hypothetical protein